jgi:hypothetical protein
MNAGQQQVSNKKKQKQFLKTPTEKRHKPSVLQRSLNHHQPKQVTRVSSTQHKHTAAAQSTRKTQAPAAGSP